MSRIKNHYDEEIEQMANESNERSINDDPRLSENYYRILALKKAAVVMGALGDSMKDGETKRETRSLAWTITWAVGELEKALGKPCSQ